MAVDNQHANPIIIEPPASSDSRPPSSLPTPSLNASSSSTSFDSSRPQSRGSSATSPSESPLPVPRDVEPHKYTDFGAPVVPDAELLPPTHTNMPDGRARDMTNSSTTQPSQRTEGSLHSDRTARASFYGLMFSNRRWLEHSLGIFGLVASLVGLLFIGVRTYKLAVITTQNSTLDGCTALIQAGVTTLENSTQLCKTIMRIGPLSSPYHLDKRKLYSSLALASKWMKGPLEVKCAFPYIGCQPQSANFTNRNVSAPAIIVSTTLALGGLVLIFALRNARSTEVFTSPASSDIHITRHKHTGSETVTGQGVLEKHPSEDHDHELGDFHKRIRASQDQDSLIKDTTPLQSTESYSTTLVDGYSEPKVSLEDRSSGEKHEGLVEIQFNRHTKAFFKLETSELFHLKHWKDKHRDSSHTSHKTDNPLSVENEGFT